MLCQSVTDAYEKCMDLGNQIGLSVCPAGWLLFLSVLHGKGWTLSDNFQPISFMRLVCL